VSTTPFLLVDDVATRYRISPWSVHERARHGQIPHRKLAGGCSRLLFIDAELTAWENGAELLTIETSSGGRVCRPKNTANLRDHNAAEAAEGK
jgi:hypothetical protein